MNKFIIIKTLLIFIAPTPIIGLIIWWFSRINNGLLFYLLLPIIIIIGLLAYLFISLILALINYKLGPKLKEGVYPLNSKMMNAWINSHIILRLSWFIQQWWWWPASIIYLKVFNSKVNKPLINGGFVEHSLVSNGENCVIGSNAEILGHIIENNKLIIKRVNIGSNVTIGAKSIIMPGVNINDNVVIGSLSLVPKNKKVNSGVYAGIPIKKIKDVAH